MIAVGLCSIFGSFFGCFPQTASFSRSSVLSTSGGQTQLANFFNGFIYSKGNNIKPVGYNTCKFRRSYSFGPCLPHAHFLFHSEIRSRGGHHNSRISDD